VGQEVGRLMMENSERALQEGAIPAAVDWLNGRMGLGFGVWARRIEAMVPGSALSRTDRGAGFSSGLAHSGPQTQEGTALDSGVASVG
jgi:hypothetical protein